MGVGDSFRGIDGVSFLFLGEQSAKCSLVGSTYGILLQCLLGVIALAFLVGKRYLEPAKVRRSWGVWAADASKQAIGAAVAHGMNMLLAARFVAGAESECLFYLVHFLTDALFGLVINILLIMTFDSIAETGFYPEVFRSGDYGYEFSWPTWFAQLSLWLGIVCVSKAVIVTAIVLPFRDPMYTIVDRIFSPLVNYPRVELFLIMVAIPLVFNAIAFWVQDSFLMRPPQEPSAGAGVWAKDNFDSAATEKKAEEEAEALASLLNKNSTYFSELVPSSFYPSASVASTPASASAAAAASTRGGSSYSYRSSTEEANALAEAAALKEAAAIAALAAAVDAAAAASTSAAGTGAGSLGRMGTGSDPQASSRWGKGVDAEKVLQGHHAELAYAGPI